MVRFGLGVLLAVLLAAPAQAQDRYALAGGCYVMTSGGAQVAKTADGGYRPVWSSDGRKLFFRYLDRVMVVDVDGSGGRIALSPVRLVADNLPDARYDVSADGRRLLMARPVGDLGPQTRIDVMVGWDPRR